MKSQFAQTQVERPSSMPALRSIEEMEKKPSLLGRIWTSISKFANLSRSRADDFDYDTWRRLEFKNEYNEYHDRKTIDLYRWY